MGCHNTIIKVSIKKNMLFSIQEFIPIAKVGQHPALPTLYSLKSSLISVLDRCCLYVTCSTCISCSDSNILFALYSPHPLLSKPEWLSYPAVPITSLFPANITSCLISASTYLLWRCWTATLFKCCWRYFIFVFRFELPPVIKRQLLFLWYMYYKMTTFI